MKLLVIFMYFNYDLKTMNKKNVFTLNYINTEWV